MKAVSERKETISKIKQICQKEKIDLKEYSTEEKDSYLSFSYLKNHALFTRILSLRKKEYGLEFRKKAKEIIVTIGGKKDLYEDLLNEIEKETTPVQDLDINEIITFLEKVDMEEEISIFTYFDGVTYHYSVDNNEYGFALEYYHFIFDGYRYHYESNNTSSFYEILKRLNKELSLYKKLMKKTNTTDEIKETNKNEYLQEIREEYQGNKKEILIIFKSTYHIIIKAEERFYHYQYTNLSNIKNMIPSLIELYLEDDIKIETEERNSCLGRGFYINKLDENHKLVLWNIEEQDLDYYLQYLKKLQSKKMKEKEYEQDITRIVETQPLVVSAGFVNILVLSIGVLIFSIFVFLLTLNFLS